MRVGVREYHASQKLELKAHELRDSLGANQFYSLLSAAFRVAGSDEADLLEQAFPGLRYTLSTRYMSPAGLMPGESWREGDLLVSMDANGKVETKEL